MRISQLKQLFVQAQSITQLNTQLKDYLRSHGVNTFAFTYYAYHPHSKNKLKYEHSSPNFEPWHKHYIEAGYETIDTTMDIVYQTTLPVYWDVEEQLRQAKTPKERQMRQDSLEFGSVKGLSIPIHGPDEDFAILLVVQMQGETCLDDWQDLQFELQSVASCYYEQLKKLLLMQLDRNNKYQLTPREMQCLQLTAQKHSVEEIAQTLKISTRTVNFHLQSVNKKLGTTNKHQSVAKALQKKLLVL